MSIREEIMRRVMYRPESLSVQQLQQSIQDGLIPGYIGIPILQEKVKQQKQAQVAGQPQQAPQTPVAEQVMQEAAGIEQLPGDVSAQGMAGGGIVAFSDGGEAGGDTFDYGSQAPVAQAPVDQPKPFSPPAPTPAKQASPVALDRPDQGIASLADTDALYKKFSDGMPAVPSLDFEEEKKDMASRRDTLSKLKDRNFDSALVQAGLAMMAGTSPYALTNIGQGGIAGMKAYATGEKDIRDLHKDIMHDNMRIKLAEREGNEKARTNAEQDRAAKIGIWKTMEELASHERVADIQSSRWMHNLTDTERKQNISILQSDLKAAESELALAMKDPTKMTKEGAARIAAAQARVNETRANLRAIAPNLYGYDAAKVTLIK